MAGVLCKSVMYCSQCLETGDGEQFCERGTYDHLYWFVIAYVRLAQRGNIWKIKTACWIILDQQMTWSILKQYSTVWSSPSSIDFGSEDGSPVQVVHAFFRLLVELKRSKRPLWYNFDHSRLLQWRLCFQVAICRDHATSSVGTPFVVMRCYLCQHQLVNLLHDLTFAATFRAEVV